MDTIRILSVGAGHMGRSHALAYQALDAFEIVGLVTRSPESRKSLLSDLGGNLPGFNDFTEALSTLKPDAVSISSYTETHYPYAKAALEQNCHVFVEKPLAETVEQAEEIANLAEEKNRKAVVGYILRHHPSWIRFVELAQSLGKPLVMRMNLNQQSSGDNWRVHKNLLKSCSPVVDCGVHYVDVMSLMTEAKPIRVSGIGARLSDEIDSDQINYGQLQVTFDDGSVGWYEAGWGPMMSETAFFVKDVIGPKGCVSIKAEEASAAGKSDDVGSHCKTEQLLLHHADLDGEGNFSRDDEWISLSDEPDHDELAFREQSYFLKAIQEDLDLSQHLADAVNSMRIVHAADQSFRTGKSIEL